MALSCSKLGVPKARMISCFPPPIRSVESVVSFGSVNRFRWWRPVTGVPFEKYALTSKWEKHFPKVSVGENNSIFELPPRSGVFLFGRFPHINDSAVHGTKGICTDPGMTSNLCGKIKYK